MTAENSKELLNRAGLRNTQDRHDLLGLFEEQRAWTVAQLHQRLPTADLSTVYRNVSALIEKGLLREAGVRGKEAYYELAKRDHHAHAICRTCGAASCVPCPIESLGQDHALEMFTTCSDCHLTDAG